MHCQCHSSQPETIKPKLLALGVLILYAVSNIYLEHVVDLHGPLLKTLFFGGYFLFWISPLILLWLRGKIGDSFVAPVLVLCLVILYTSALSTIPVPMGRNLPDVDFHAAKILYCSFGSFFYDPATSFPSIYPPVYHIIIGSIMRLLGSDNSWLILSRFHILILAALFLSVYHLANCLFNPRTGLLSVLFFAAVFVLPNQGMMFFPTPFHLGLTIIISSVTLVYLAQRSKRWYLYPAGFATGLAVTIWPAFLPTALALFIVTLLAPEKGSRRPSDLLRFILPFLATAAVVWLPQYLLLSRYHLVGHHSIGQFKGIPDPSWFLDFLLRFILLGGFDRHQQWVTFLFGVTYSILLVVAVFGFRSLGRDDPRKKRFLGWLSVLMLASLPIVHYVFSMMYSRRVQMLFSTLMVVVAARHLMLQLNKKYRMLGVVFIAWMIIFTTGWNVYVVHDGVSANKNRYEDWKKYATEPLRFLKYNTKFGEYIFATESAYRFVVFGEIVRFNLVAHREGSYYSLDPDLSERMKEDYDVILNSEDFPSIKKVLDNYGITYILMREGEQLMYPGMRQLVQNCPPAYRDENYAVLKCPPSPK